MKSTYMRKYIGNNVQSCFGLEKVMKTLKNFMHIGATARKKANRINFLLTYDGTRINKDEGMNELMSTFRTSLQTQVRKFQM